MSETLNAPVNLPEEVDGNKDYTRIFKTMRSYLIKSDFINCIGLLFPPVDRITPKGNVAILADSSLGLPIGMTIANFVEQAEDVNGEKVNKEEVIERSDDQPIYLMSDGGSSYHYSLITKERAEELLEEGEEYTFIE